MKGLNDGHVVRAESGWYHGAVEASVPGSLGWRLFVLRLLKMPSSGVLGRVLPCDVPFGYASVVPLPVALLEGHFEQSHKRREVTS